MWHPLVSKKRSSAIDQSKLFLYTANPGFPEVMPVICRTKDVTVTECYVSIVMFCAMKDTVLRG